MPSLKFNCKIYKKELIEKAALDFAHLAQFTITAEKGYVVVKGRKIVPEVRSILFDEFANYILAQTRKCL